MKKKIKDEVLLSIFWLGIEISDDDFDEAKRSLEFIGKLIEESENDG